MTLATCGVVCLLLAGLIERIGRLGAIWHRPEGSGTIRGTNAFGLSLLLLLLGFIAACDISYRSGDGAQVERPQMKRLSEMTCEEAEDAYQECYERGFINQARACGERYYPVLWRCYGAPKSLAPRE